MLIDQGWLADGDGKVIDFRQEEDNDAPRLAVLKPNLLFNRNCIILMTAAVESQLLTSQVALFQRSPEALNRLLSRHFSPDFLNCLDAVIPFVRCIRCLPSSILLKSP